MKQLRYWIGIPFLRTYISKRLAILKKELDDDTYHDMTNDELEHISGQSKELEALLVLLKEYEARE